MFPVGLWELVSSSCSYAARRMCGDRSYSFIHLHARLGISGSGCSVNSLNYCNAERNTTWQQTVINIVLCSPELYLDCLDTACRIFFSQIIMRKRGNKNEARHRAGIVLMT